MTKRTPIESPMIDLTKHPRPKIGAPSNYTKDIADRVCKRLSAGESLRSITKDPTMPCQTTVYEWLCKHPTFAEQYTHAREEQADTLADEIIAIADETPTLTQIKDKEGKVVELKIDSGYVAYQKQRIEARKWTAMKLKPKKYGDRVVHAGDDENPVVLENNLNVFGELLKSIKLSRQSE